MGSKQENKKWNYYYDAMEYLDKGNSKEAESLLQNALEVDKDFVAGYVGLTAVARAEDNYEKEKKYTKLTFKKTRKIFPEWPEEMPWGVIKNRQYLRAICNRARIYHLERNLQDAQRLYRLLLKLNPNDNQGVRYLLAGLFADLSPRDIESMFDEANEKQDRSKLNELLKKQNKKHKFWDESDGY